MSTEPRKVWVTENRCTGLSRVFYTEELCYETLQPNDQIYILIEHSAYQALEQKLAVAQKELEKCGEVITCVKCSEKAECPYAYDGYNTNGDCLAEK